MPPDDPRNLHLKRLRAWRNRADGDPALGAFLPKQFKQEVERPYKQMGALAGLWAKLLPRELAEHTVLEGLSRGVLKVAVDSSPRLYELDRLLRSGLERALVTAHKGPALRRIQLRVAAPRSADSPGRVSPPRGPDAEGEEG